VLTTVAVWSPVLFCVVGVVLLLVSVGPRRIVVTALMFLLLGCLGLVATHRVLGAVFWWVSLAATLTLAGLFFVVSGIRSPVRPEHQRRPGAPLVLRRFWRAGPDWSVPQDTEAVAVTACFADAVLDLAHVGKQVAVEVDVTVVFGDVTVRVPRAVPEDLVVTHHAFVLTKRGLAAAPLPKREPGKPKPVLTVVVIGIGGAVTVLRELDENAGAGQPAAAAL
jgi:hypothetical protein